MLKIDSIIKRFLFKNTTNYLNKFLNPKFL
jgi:hypothetical protein